jgi:gliding motility-associated-like protein
MRNFILLVFLSAYFHHFSQNDKVWMHPNRGQWYEKIKYKVDLNNGSMYIENNAFTYVFHNVGELKHHHDSDKKHEENENLSLEDKIVQHTIKTTFLNSNQTHGVNENKKSDFYRNYFLGNDQSKWRSNINSISELKYSNFYDGIDLVIEGKKEELKYSFIVQPAKDPSVIKYKIDGANSVKIDKKGNLILTHIYGEIIESKPIAWTIDKNGTKSFVKIEFKITNNIVYFNLPNGYKTEETLVIDPQLTFSSFTGSSADNWGCTATPDLAGNLYAGGTVFGIGYPTTPGVLAGGYIGGENIGYGGFDVSLSKFNANGSAFLYSTYVGGNRNECPNSMITNANGELYIMGVTSSDNFPMNGASYQAIHNGGTQINLESSQAISKTDIFIARISPTGSAYMNSTFVGGTGNDGVNVGNSGANDGDLVFNYGDNFRGEIILDNAGNIIVASSTRSSNFPTVNPSQTNISGVQDAVLFKMTPNLSTMLWSTYYGGTGIDCGNAVAVNSQNEVYLVGGTLSVNLNVPLGHVGSFAGGTCDGFLTRFNGANGAVLSGTYVGTNDYDQCFFVQTDIDDFVYVYGQSNGVMPITNGLFGNITNRQFIRKYNTNLSGVEWNTKIGGFNQSLSPTAFLVSSCFEIYIAGWGGGILSSNISNFPTTPDAFQRTSTDGDAFYLAVYEPNMTNLKYATFMGGAGDDHVDGGTSRFDKSGRVYHAVCAACGGTNNGFITTPGVISGTNNSSNCNLAAFKFELNSIQALVAEPNFIICIPNPVQFFNNSVEGDVYLWDFGDGNFSSEANPQHAYLSVGDYTVKLLVSDSQGCKSSDSTSFIVSVGSFEAGNVVTPPTICKGSSYQFDAYGGISYVWSPAQFLDNPNIPNPTATIFDTTTFLVIISDTCGRDTLYVTLNVFQDLISVSADTSICVGNSIQIQVFGAQNQAWTPNVAISNQNSNSPFVNPDVTTTYFVNATTSNGCEFNDSVRIAVFSDTPIPILDDSLSMCIGSNLLITASGSPNYLWSPNQFINTIFGNQVVVSPPNNFIYYCEFINACGSLLDSIFIEVIIPRVNAYNDTIICEGESIVLRAEGAKTYEWSPSSSLNNAFLQSVTANPSVSTTYTVIGIDDLGCVANSSVSVQLFPKNQVFTDGTIYANIGDNVQLNATSNVEGSYIWLPETYLSCSVCQSPIAQPNYNFTYNVVFIDTNGCRTTNLVYISYKGIIYVPNTFTPDGSKFNEVFKAYGEGINQFEMLIFNRWGELIKTLNSIDDYWDGRYKGQMCQDGTYTWKLTFNDITGVYQTLTGHVNLLK